MVSISMHVSESHDKKTAPTPCTLLTPRALLTPLDFGFPNSRQRFYLLAARAARTDHASLSLSSTEVVKPVGQFLEDWF